MSAIWRKRPFDDLFEDVSSGHPRLKSDEYRNSGKHPIIDQGEKSICGFTDDDANLAEVSFPVIIFGDHTRKLKYVDHPFCVGADGVKIYKPVSDIDPRYAYRYLQSLRIESAGYSRHSKFLRQKEIFFPLDINEQKRIAAIVDETDNLRLHRQKLMENLTFLRTITFAEIFGNPAKNNKGWPVGIIGDIIDSTQYGTSLPADEVGSFPILRMGNITYSGEVDLSDLKYIDLPVKDIDKHTVRHGDILFNRTNSPDLVGKTAIYKGKEPLAYAGYLVRVRCDETKSHPEYISGFLNSAYGKATLRGMCKTIIGMANINAKELAAIKIPIPPLDLQRAFAARVAEIDKLKALHRAHLAKLDELFASLQHRAFRGEL